MLYLKYLFFKFIFTMHIRKGGTFVVECIAQAKALDAHIFSVSKYVDFAVECRGSRFSFVKNDPLPGHARDRARFSNRCEPQIE